MRKLLSLLTLLALLTACASYAPGDDPKGQQLQGVGQQVLQAARNYMDQNARPPHSLQDLVPKYLPALPDQPAITYDPQMDRFEFRYKQEGFRGAEVTCHALLGETDWICNASYTEQ